MICMREERKRKASSGAMTEGYYDVVQLSLMHLSPVSDQASHLTRTWTARPVPLTAVHHTAIGQ